MKVFFPEFRTRFVKFSLPNERKSLERYRLEKEAKISRECQELALNVTGSGHNFFLLLSMLAGE
jgi:hypothetical protein